MTPNRWLQGTHGAASYSFASASFRRMKLRTVMWGRAFLGLCLVAVNTYSVLAAEVARVGMLFPGSASSTAFAEKAFWARMGELGWHEAENVSATNLHADGDP